MPDHQLRTLTRLNTQDFLSAFGVDRPGVFRPLLEALCLPASRRFARQVAAFDATIGRLGLQAAAQGALPRYARQLDLHGLQGVPTSGPLLVLCNHPGLTDALALFSSLPRPDLRALAAKRPFLEALPNLAARLIPVPDDLARRMGVVRQAAAHLREGGAIVTYPAGQIEPDPASMPGALASLERWSPSIALFTRLVPETQVVVAIVSGVVWPPAYLSPLARLRRLPADQEKLGAALQALVQVLLPFYRPVAVRIAVSPPFRLAPSLLGVAASPEEVMRLITAQARQLIAQIPAPGQPRPGTLRLQEDAP